MKVQLIVVQGKPEGKAIPLVGRVFKIGRGENCHLRPSSEQVSREHAEFTVTSSTVTVRDLKSRNGTIVNGKLLTEPCLLKDRDIVQVGPLTFSVSIQGVPAVPRPSPTPTAKSSSGDDATHDDIDSWLIGDKLNPPPERPSGIYGGDTATIATYNAPKSPEPPKPDTPAKEPEDEGDETIEMSVEEAESAAELDDESNPFHVPKPKPKVAVKASSRDSSDVASDILRKMMERRKGPK